MTDNRKRLGTAVFRRRVDMGLTSRRALAEYAAVGKRTVDSIEIGERVSEKSMYKIERALGWEPGSASIVLDGGSPILAATADPPDPQPEPPSDEELAQMAESLEQQVQALREMLRRRSESA